MKQRMLHLFAPSLLLAAVLMGCNKEESDSLPGGTQPVTLTATMEGQSSAQAAQSATRATVDNTWTGGEEVAVQIGGEVKKYTAASGGQLSVTDGGSPFYWTSSTERKTVSAWTPYSDTKPTSLSVQADQSSEGYQQSDMIYATQQISYASPKLEFCHLPVKVVVNLKNGEGVTQAEVQNATVSIVNQNLTSGAISAADWIVAQVDPGSSTIIPNTLATATTNYQKTVQALLVPQTSTTSKRLIKVNVGGLEFFYSTTLDFAAGTQHTYNITVLKSGLSVTASGAQAWTGNETAVTSKEPVAGFADKDLKIGDYYYSDGETSDGGYRKYADNSTVHLPVMPVLTDASGNARTVIGIVYQKSADGKTGKIVSLDEGTGKTWEDAQKWTSSITLPSGMTWSVPAKEELQHFYCGYIGVAAQTWDSGNCPASEVTGAKSAFNAQLTAANGTVLSNSYYWSSTELSGYSAWPVSFSIGGADFIGKGNFNSVRVVSAF